MNTTKPCPHCEGTGNVTDPVADGAELRRFREAHRISLRQCARALGVSPAYLSDVERGKRIASQLRLRLWRDWRKNYPVR